MIYLVESSLRNFPAWSGALDTLNVIDHRDLFEEVERLIDEVFADKQPTMTEINDFLWFERDFIAKEFGFNDFDDMSHSDI